MITSLIVPRRFYTQPTLEVAQKLLGKYLVRIYQGERLVGKIVETEAYLGPRDKASHGYLNRKTARNEAEFLIGGHIYIYLVYGMYWQLNISTYQADKPECVLIRALEPIEGLEIMAKNRNFNSKELTLKEIKNLTNGPGKLCQALALDKSFYGEDLTKSQRIWLEPGEKINPSQIKKAKRIGIDYAGPYWANRLWRFYLKDNQFVSVK